MVDRDVAPARPQRVEHLPAVVLEIAVEGLVAQHLGPQLPEGSLVAHQAHDAAADAKAELVGVQAADPHHALRGPEAIPLAQVAPGRMGHVALGARDEPDRLADAGQLLAVVGHEAPHLEAVEGVEVLPLHALAQGPHAGEALGPGGEGMGGEAHAAAGAHGLGDLAGRQPAVVEHGVEPEGEHVVAPDG